ncbi:MAG: GGDEF domain-containing protein [Rhodospirillaceae bacterium]|nr:GGDEF domain-containing protein [Rhodospirillaceae bacterium]MBT6139128.1 GGDEF domain-containing protein [Rhodospirillaceae bacterium]
MDNQVRFEEKDDGELVPVREPAHPISEFVAQQPVTLMAIAVILICVAIDVLLFPNTAEHVAGSIVGDVVLVGLSLAGLAYAERVRGLPEIHNFWVSGFIMMAVASTVDLLDEFIVHPHAITIVFEDMLHIAGFASLIVGLVKWVAHNNRQVERLAHMASTDPLTGAWNRQRIEEAVDQEISRRARYGGNFSLILFDIDGFKQINDDYGHETGDKVLLQVAGVIRQNIRASDLLARVGGEEFEILAPDTNRDGALKFAEHLRKVLSENVVSPSGDVTASFGIVEYQTGETMSTLRVRVDRALYQAKEAGRNRVMAA